VHPNENELSRDTVLVRRPELALELGSSGTVVVRWDNQRVETNEHALGLLDAWRVPRAIAGVVDELAIRGALDFLTLTRTILELWSAGALIEPEKTATLGETVGWATSSIHTRMLGDLTRTRAFIRALEETIRPDDVVLDIGTGTGVLAIAAAKAGARKVYAIESSAIADVASAMIVGNRVDDRVELVRGWSTRAELPERASVLVTETLGDEALGEGLVETMLDATRRLVLPDARIIPARVEVWAIPCSLSPALRNRHLFTRDNISLWSAEFGIDFGPLEGVGRRPFALTLSPDEVRGFRHLSPAVRVADFDLREMDPSFDRPATFTAEAAGLFEAALLYFDLQLSPNVRFRGSPLETDERHHWSYPVWISDRPAMLAVGESATLRYRYRAGVGRIAFH